MAEERLGIRSEFFLTRYRLLSWWRAIVRITHRFAFFIIVVGASVNFPYPWRTNPKILVGPVLLGLIWLIEEYTLTRNMTNLEHRIVRWEGGEIEDEYIKLRYSMRSMLWIKLLTNYAAEPMLWLYAVLMIMAFRG